MPFTQDQADAIAESICALSLNVTLNNLGLVNASVVTAGKVSLSAALMATNPPAPGSPPDMSSMDED